MLRFFYNNWLSSSPLQHSRTTVRACEQLTRQSQISDYRLSATTWWFNLSIRRGVKSVLSTLSNFEYILPHPHFVPPYRVWPRSNFADIVGARKLDSLGCRMAPFAWFCVQQFWHSTGLWQTDRQTQDDSTYRASVARLNVSHDLSNLTISLTLSELKVIHLSAGLFRCDFWSDCAMLTRSELRCSVVREVEDVYGSCT